MSNRLLAGALTRIEPFAEPHVSLWAPIKAAWRRHRSRQRITRLDGHLLKDIGVTYSEAETEANKPFWRV
jgi:uncharacterized protein YjiS (DUF1127 family)